VKFSSIYSNKAEIFPKILFNKGFNVIFAQVKDPSLKDKDSHNLGKSFFIQILDFALLGDLDKTHAFKEHPDIFNDFIFYLEIETVNGFYVTVKRPVRTGKINIHVSKEEYLDLQETPKESWTYTELSLQKARTQLNEILDLESIIPFEYRKGLGYFMRRQSDYDEVFRISKFQSGADKYWKPFVALLLGLEHEITTKKYEVEDHIKKLEDKRIIFEEEAGSKSNEYDEVRGLLEIRQSAVAKLRTELDSFSFQNIESQISEISTTVIEADIANLNERRYTIDYELQEIERSLDFKLQFNVDRIKRVFDEASLTLPDALIHSYSDLEEFNKRISVKRIERLKELQVKLNMDRQEIEQNLKTLDVQRQDSLKILQDKETFNKFKELQRILLGQEREIGELQLRLTQLDKAANTQRDIDKEKEDLSKTITNVRDSVNKDNKILAGIRRTFSDCVMQVLRVEALISVIVNKNGNLEFNVRTLDRNISERETSEDQGTSYRKMLAACFDLTLLIEYSSKKFYRFAYHDGIFEGLDNRRKVSLLNMLREACGQFGIQYILTVIDSDLPRDQTDQKLLFTDQEIIRYLNDSGDSGRLFRTRAF
jgi:uncharacterized protein YydD (DUF2326 family)